VATKSCPSCGAEVPVEAHRCKHCFHDFNEVAQKKAGPMVLLFFLAAMLVIGGGVLAWVFQSRAAEFIVVDEETRSIVITRKSATETDTTRVSFDKVEKVEHVMGGEDSMFEVVAVTLDGGRYVIQSSDEKPLVGHAQHVAQVIDKPFVEVKNVRGFGN
jgi:hypothetical protein